MTGGLKMAWLEVEYAINVGLPVVCTQTPFVAKVRDPSPAWKAILSASFILGAPSALNVLPDVPGATLPVRVTKDSEPSAVVLISPLLFELPTPTPTIVVRNASRPALFSAGESNVLYAPGPEG